MKFAHPGGNDLDESAPRARSADLTYSDCANAGFRANCRRKDYLGAVAPVLTANLNAIKEFLGPVRGDLRFQRPRLARRTRLPDTRGNAALQVREAVQARPQVELKNLDMRFMAGGD